MKIGIIRETKNPVDNRVALTPKQVKDLKQRFADSEFKVQTSEIRAFSDEEYIEQGIEVCENLNDCDLLLGIKEANVGSLIPNKHYMFFGHIAKKQTYNIPLFKKLIDSKITFSDYEYLVDNNGQRLVAFGWFAGVVGVYYTLMGWGQKTGLYTLPCPTFSFSIDEIVNNILKAKIGNLKIVLTGNGRVSHGAQHVLDKIGATKVSCDEFVNDRDLRGIVYCVATTKDLVEPNNTELKFEINDFKNNPEQYHDTFHKFASTADILISGHFWNNNQPVYITEQLCLCPDFRIKMIGDVTCDIKGSIKTTLRSTTHADPFFDYNPNTGQEEIAFSSPDNITVMAVDTCPNALPRVTSEYFGEQLIKYVLNDILKNPNESSKTLEGATILNNGVLTQKFGYLKDYVDTFA